MFATKSELDEFARIRQPINDNLINKPILTILEKYNDYDSFTKDFSPVRKTHENT